VSSKQIAIELIKQLPEEASLTEIAHEIEFVAGIREGTAQIARGEFFSAEDVLRQIPEWVKSTK